MNQEVFYATSAALCFTLLGFWWVVVQFRHADLTSTRGARAFSLLVSLQFILPGFISLASLAAGEDSPLWRLVFATAGVCGLLAGMVALRLRGRERALGLVGGLTWLTAPAYIVLTLIPLRPDVLRNAGFVPIQVEAFVLIALLLIGVLIAWFLFVEPAAADAT